MERTEFINQLKGLDTDGKTTIDLYNEISSLAMNYGLSGAKEPADRNAYYLSMEFLIGRSFFNNLLELGVLEETRNILAQKGIDINVFEEIEDAALGNGGLGRLAACFLDSAAGLGLPLQGYGIRYKYGLFKQAIVNGFQVELPDDWQRFGDPWSQRKEEEKRTVKFADMTVTAVPYDVPVFGKRVNVLRLWQAEGNADAEKISEYLYPADDTEEGKLLRLRQEYFFSAAAVGELVEKHVKKFGKRFDNFALYDAIQLNDTHPVLAIAELIKILTADYKVRFSAAIQIAKETFSYTNHTVMPEALECWSADLIKKILPDIYALLMKLYSKQKKELKKLHCTRGEISEMAIYSPKKFSMANLAVFIGNTVNGVAKLHTKILKNDLFKTAYKYYPEKFQNKTNGITQRRWLMLCNRELSELIDKTIGAEWRSDISKLSGLNSHIERVADEFIKIKAEKKRQLFEYIEQHEGIKIPDHFIVYAQVKRLHEYKRQLMTAFAILEIYKGLKDGTIKNFYPSVFIFGAKSAPSYKRAKAIIKFINEIAGKVNADEEMNGLLKVVFVQNYNVSYAEKIVAGTDASLQVSTAGLEASGTGNMKFMMNGAVTCGTMDGANIEIVELAGRENNYIFGAEVDEIERLKSEGYDPCALLKTNALHNYAVSSLIDGTFPDGDTGCFKELYDALTVGASWHKPDHYFVLHDLEGFVKALLKINADYQDRTVFALKQLKNTANSAYFSSDRTIEEYSSCIWKLKK
ncbi:MAG: glycogen/starch/alpha-glucan family phosphorylase [Clostridia bacterium]|nr:glycogen/starch/alpha-glucan family phosphorylase [Clostridia bacterium]